MRKLIFKLGIQRIFCAFFQTLISWSGNHKLRKILCYFSQKKITNSKTPSVFKLSKEFLSSRNFKMSNHFSFLFFKVFLNNYTEASLEMHFSLI